MQMSALLYFCCYIGYEIVSSAVTVSKHLRWLVVPTLLCPDNEVSNQAWNERRALDFQC